MNALLVATSNPHKIDEIRAVLVPLGIDVIGLNDLAGSFPEPVEDGSTFAQNARIKALAYARATDRRCLADDSGLQVDALDGAPGIYSARYAGIGDTRAQRDAANNEKLLRQLEGIPAERKTARFVCAMCVADPDGTIIAETEATFEGLITDAPRGDNGFGYDPLLWLPEDGCTSAELPPPEKNARSHRGGATRLIARHLCTNRPDADAPRTV
jgi:XTP/dITP diphosphohydrolase